MPDFDVLIVGGGINGCGIARDAAGRGLRVALAEMGDLGGATSSASTKLFHGGLRYLEYLEFRLVREALIERETLLSAMPHIAWPMRFVLPIARDMRFDTTTPVSRMVPFLRGRRPAWMIRAGLFLYDHLAPRKALPGTATLRLGAHPAGAALKPEFARAFEYSDVWVDDARLVVLNARDAAARGAAIWPRTQVVAAERGADHWVVRLRDGAGAERSVTAKALVNAAGPWAAQVFAGPLGQGDGARLRLVRGSHIVVPRIADHDRAYFLQGPDGRIVFAIPYEDDFTLIGTTDVDHPDPDTRPACTDAERDYLLDFVNRYLRDPLTAADVVWTYSGVRALFDDGSGSASAATRDYRVDLDTGAAPLLSIWGGKITTYRKLAEAALGKLAPETRAWTAGVALPGGDFADPSALVRDLMSGHGFLGDRWAHRLARCYGTEALAILGTAKSASDLGEDFGATLTAAEVDWLMAREWARTPEDVLWRRTKLGLRITAEGRERLSRYMETASADQDTPAAATGNW